MASPTRAGAESAGLSRTLGTVHLFLASTTNVASGAVLVWLAVSGQLLPVAIERVGRYVTPATALRYGDVLAFAATEGAVLVGAVLVGLGVFGCAGADGFARGERSRRRGIALACCNGVNPIALPLAFVAAALLAIPRVGPAVRDPTEGGPPVEMGAVPGDERNEDTVDDTGDREAVGTAGVEEAKDDADYGGEPTRRS